MAAIPEIHYTIKEVAQQAGVSRKTVLRWLKAGKIPEPGRDRNWWRAFTRQEAQAVVRFAGKYLPPDGAHKTGQRNG